MPVTPEEPEIHERIPGPGVPFPHRSDAPAPRTPATGRPTAPVAPSAAVPGPRPAPPRPAPRPAPPRGAQIPKPGPAPRRPEPVVQLVPAGAGEALDRADETVDVLLESGRRPGDVLVLTVGEPHPWQQHELSFGEGAYWAQLAEGGDVFYADAAAVAAGARSLRREVVVLVVNDRSRNRVEQAARKALGHAVALLVVCGDADLVAPVLPMAGRPVPA